MPKPSAFDVLEVDVDASVATIKAAWRRLARAHHPDLTAGDAHAARLATRQMAEINAAYEELRDPVRRRAAALRARTGSGGRTGGPDRPDGRRPAGDRFGHDADGTGGGTGPGSSGGSRSQRSGPPSPRTGRPVTAHLDTSQTFSPRNQTLGGRRAFHSNGQPPLRAELVPPEPPRASDPTGPLSRARMRHFRPPARPALGESMAHTVEFGKFRGHTLGEIAAFEPSYIDWIAQTITRDPELVASAKVIKDDLDARGIVRDRRAPSRPNPSPLA
jgi:curved DNA-binding protein CbpA